MAMRAFARSRSDPLETCSVQGRGMEWRDDCWSLRGSSVGDDRNGVRRGRVSDGDSSAAISASSRHRDNFTGKQFFDRITHTEWDHAVCASSQVGARPPVWLEAGTADRERKAQTTTRSAAAGRLHRRGYWHSRISRNTCAVLSEGSGAVDKLGMNVCGVSGRSSSVWRLVPLKRPASTPSNQGFARGLQTARQPLPVSLWGSGSTVHHF
jgi:hypothetical protein